MFSYLHFRPREVKDQTHPKSAYKIIANEVEDVWYAGGIKTHILGSIADVVSHRPQAQWMFNSEFQTVSFDPIPWTCPSLSITSCYHPSLSLASSFGLRSGCGFGFDFPFFFHFDFPFNFPFRFAPLSTQWHQLT